LRKLMLIISEGHGSEDLLSWTTGVTAASRLTAGRLDLVASNSRCWCQVAWRTFEKRELTVTWCATHVLATALAEQYSPTSTSQVVLVNALPDTV
jgi:hypothetical protein